MAFNLVRDATGTGTSIEVSEMSEPTTKGSIIAGDGSGGPSELAVGTNGNPLVAASGETTGLKYLDLVMTGGTNTFNLTNGTASLDVAASSAVNIDANLTVESASLVNQDLTSDASPTFGGLALGVGNMTLTGSIADTTNRVTKGWFTDLEVTNAIAGSVTGNAGTVSTITGLAPDTATTQATQGAITSLGTLTSLTMGGTLAMGVNSITMTGSIADTTNRVLKGWFTDLEVTNAIAGSITGNAGTVSTITGLAPDTATTQATQGAITSLGTLTTLTVDDITINGNTISSAGSSTLAINPTAGQAITFDSTVTLDAGVIAGATSITSGTLAATSASSLTLGTASSAAGGIIMQNATNANTVTVQSGVTSTTYALTLPLAVAGAGEVLTDAAGDGVLSWAAASSGGAAKMFLNPMFEVIANYNTNTVSSGTVTVAAGPFLNTRCATGANSLGEIGVIWGQAALDRNLYDMSPEMNFCLDMNNITGTDSHWAIISGESLGGGFPTEATGAKTDDHLGFLFIIDTSALELYASNANGTTQTLTDVASGNSVTVNSLYRVVMDGTTDIKFYIDGTLEATHTTNLPSGAQTAAYVARFGSRQAAAGGTQTDARWSGVSIGVLSES